MSRSRFSFPEHPWLSLSIVILAYLFGLALFGILVFGLFRHPRDAAMAQVIVSLLAHSTVLFVLVPFILRLPAGTRAFGAYVEAIRLSRLQPFAQLLLLGLSCYHIPGEARFRLASAVAPETTPVRPVRQDGINPFAD